jgi:hypothetical protein
MSISSRPIAGTASVLLAIMPISCDSPTLPPTDSLDGAAVRQLFSRMDRLVTALEALPAAPLAATGGSEPPSERALVADDRGELLERIETLEQALTSLRRRSGMAPPPRPAAAPPIRPAAVSFHRKQMDSGDQAIVRAARRAHFRLTEDQILRQYGMPSESRVQQNGSVLWVYQADDKSSGFIFVNGLVSSMW